MAEGFQDGPPPINNESPRFASENEFKTRLARGRAAVDNKIRETLSKNGDASEQLKNIDELKQLRNEENPLLKKAGESAYKTERALKHGAIDTLQAERQLQIKDIEFNLAKTAVRQETERANANWEMATTDELTKLENKLGFDIHIQQLFREARDEGLPVAVILIDLQDMKVLNDKYGHNIGDHYLKAVADIFNQNKRKDDLVARIQEYKEDGNQEGNEAEEKDEDAAGRLGGDEFAIAAKGLNKADMDNYWSRLYHKLTQLEIPLPDEKGGGVHRVGLGAGYYIVQPEQLAGLSDTDMKGFADTVKTLADNALYVAKYRSKQAGRDLCEIYDYADMPLLEPDEVAKVEAYREESSQARNKPKSEVTIETEILPDNG